MDFCKNISAHYAENKRDLPWRKTKDPYKIWLSEIIMQQTQISQGTSYYLKFAEKYPTVFDLAKADEKDVLLLWQGLGYYSRARNLHHTAKEIVQKHKGKFPQNYQDLIKLKGIGDYTASAILSICFNRPYPAVDGNVLRVIARIFNVREPVNTNYGKNFVKEICEKLICKENPGDFNQALMDFGATICSKSNPNCKKCIFNNQCFAFENNIISELPVKIKASKKQTEYFYYFLFKYTNKIFLQKRTNGIWKNLYEYILINQTKKLTDKELQNTLISNLKLSKNVTFKRLKKTKHILSHKILNIEFCEINLKNKNEFPVRESVFKINLSELHHYPFPEVIRKFNTEYFNFV